MTAALNHRIATALSFGNIPGTITNNQMDASGMVMQWIFAATSTEAITHVGFRVGARTGTPPTYSARLEGLGTDGNPDNADKGGGSPTAATFTPPADTSWDGTFQWIALTNSYTPTLGEILCFTVRYSSGTINSTNRISLTESINSFALNSGLPWVNVFNGTSWSRNANQMGPIGWKGASGVYGLPTSGLVSASVITSGHRACAGITIPTTFGTSFTLQKLVAAIDPGVAGSTTTLGVWDTAGNVVASTSGIDTDWFVSANQKLVHWTPATQPTLSCGTKYYYGLQSVGSSINVGGLQMSAASDRKAYPNGENQCLATWNGSAWSEDTTLYPLIELVAEDLTLPSGGGAGSIVIGNSGSVIRGLI